MATITITIPDAAAPRVLNALASFWHYQILVPDPPGPDIPNPQSKADFVKQHIIAEMKRKMLQSETFASQQTIQTEIDAINLT